MRTTISPLVNCVNLAAEVPSVAGRWRALCRKNVKALLSTSEKREAVAHRALAEHVADILFACGVPQPHGELLSDGILRRFGGAFRDIARLALEFQSIVGEQVVSRDLFAVDAEAGAPFDPRRMIDDWAGPKESPSPASPEGWVLGATQLGLVVEKGSAGIEDGVDSVVLLKPKVVLSTALEDLWKEQVKSVQAHVDTAEVVVVDNGASALLAETRFVIVYLPAAGSRRYAEEEADSQKESLVAVTEPEPHREVIQVERERTRAGHRRKSRLSLE